MRRRQHRWCRNRFARGRRSRGRRADRADTRARRWPVGLRPSSFSTFSRGGLKSAGGRFAPGRPVSGLLARAARAPATAAGKPPGGWPSRPSNNSTTLSGNASSRCGSSTSSGVRLLVDQEQRHVADDLRGRRDLDDVAEELVHLGIRLADLVPARRQAQRLGLLVQVGVLAAGHLVLIDVGRAAPSCRSRTACRTRAPPPSTRPSRRAPPDRAACRAGEAQRLDQRVQARLDGQAGHRSAWRRRRCRGRPRPPCSTLAACDAAGVVRVEMDRDADLLLQRLDQRLGGVGLAQAGHVLDGQQVGAQLLQFLGQLDVILQVVLGAASGSRMSPV